MFIITVRLTLKRHHGRRTVSNLMAPHGAKRSLPLFHHSVPETHISLLIVLCPHRIRLVYPCLLARCCVSVINGVESSRLQCAPHQPLHPLIQLIFGSFGAIHNLWKLISTAAQNHMLRKIHFIVRGDHFVLFVLQFLDFSHFAVVLNVATQTLCILQHGIERLARIDSAIVLRSINRGEMRRQLDGMKTLHGLLSSQVFIRMA
mmetsp:Transcript_11997/g.19286  ORF Transcript_11997/g.19286 Transcript_11997/m.19286 type:complete len:204 (+) Transcript_11997:71-682(+)